MGVWFIKNELTLRRFLPLGGEASGYTLATRLHLGVAGGASLAAIPADERMYAGVVAASGAMPIRRSARWTRTANPPAVVL